MTFRPAGRKKFSEAQPRINPQCCGAIGGRADIAEGYIRSFEFVDNVIAAYPDTILLTNAVFYWS